MDALERQKAALAFSTMAGLAQFGSSLKALADSSNSLHPDSASGVYEALSTLASGLASASVFNLRLQLDKSVGAQLNLRWQSFRHRDEEVRQSLLRLAPFAPSLIPEETI
ncbi:hypothetical protein Hamer_G031078 [Homarus americanus]|uniref:Uncharacterized protein n=1 Tax=Homarus americanus TaxID=6706 RepID=A0A8J5MW20_HOMAM|nr:hypothetical protein Hamer_G031078 [Homarus americanus]